MPSDSRKLSVKLILMCLPTLYGVQCLCCPLCSSGVPSNYLDVFESLEMILRLLCLCLCLYDRGFEAAFVP
ncbi:hypothetical protein SDJN02_15738, partial [Cucurbita argyrosperma subsp. argyrosperma]